MFDSPPRGIYLELIDQTCFRRKNTLFTLSLYACMIVYACHGFVYPSRRLAHLENKPSGLRAFPMASNSKDIRVVNKELEP